MKKYHLDQMIKGWFVGDFEPTAFKTKDVEVCFGTHKKGERPRPHFHKIAPEITYVIRGKVQVNGQVFEQGDIFVIDPMEVSTPIILEDSEVIVVKVPSLPEDKYFDDIDSA
jgi:quercetin dioxygenase-like cupin family protein